MWLLKTDVHEDLQSYDKVLILKYQLQKIGHRVLYKLVYESAFNT